MMRRSVASGQRILLLVARIVRRNELKRRLAKMTRSPAMMKRGRFYVITT